MLGERLDGKGGTWVLVDSKVWPGVHQVYNLTVENEHVYRVGFSGILVHNNGCAVDPSVAPKGGADDVLHHYTDAKGAAGISESGVIRTDGKGRVYLTTDKVSPDQASDALFMGQGGTKGTHRVDIRLNDQSGKSLQGGTQPNELVHDGTIRNGRNATIEVKENDF